MDDVDHSIANRAAAGPGYPATVDAGVRRIRLIGRLVALRRGSGLTQKAVAERMGVGQSVVAEIEGGRLNVRVSTLERYAAAVSDGRLHLDLVATPDVDRSEIRRTVRMSDAEREAYYFASNGNMLRLFADARRRDR